MKHVIQELKQLSEVNKRRILELKKKGELLRGANHHKTQCDSIPHSNLMIQYMMFILNHITKGKF